MSKLTDFVTNFSNSAMVFIGKIETAAKADVSAVEAELGKWLDTVHADIKAADAFLLPVVHKIENSLLIQLHFTNSEGEHLVSSLEHDISTNSTVVNIEDIINKVETEVTDTAQTDATKVVTQAAQAVDNEVAKVVDAATSGGVQLASVAGKTHYSVYVSSFADDHTEQEVMVSSLAVSSNQIVFDYYATEEAIDWSTVVAIRTVVYNRTGNPIASFLHAVSFNSSAKVNYELDSDPTNTAALVITGLAFNVTSTVPWGFNTPVVAAKAA